MLEGRYSSSTRITNGIGVNKCKRDMNTVDVVQRRATRVMKRLWHFFCEQRLRELCLISIEKEWLSRCITTCRKVVKRL